MSLDYPPRGEPPHPPEAEGPQCPCADAGVDAPCAHVWRKNNNKKISGNMVWGTAPHPAQNNK